MAERVVTWTETASRQRREILKYWTARNGTPAYAEKLLRLTQKRLKVILENPESYKQTIFRDTRISAMGHFSILYKITSSQIIVTSFWDNRQDPKKLFELLKDQ